MSSIYTHMTRAITESTPFPSGVAFVIEEYANPRLLDVVSSNRKANEEGVEYFVGELDKTFHKCTKTWNCVSNRGNQPQFCAYCTEMIENWDAAVKNDILAPFQRGHQPTLASLTQKLWKVISGQTSQNATLNQVTIGTLSRMVTVQFSCPIRALTSHSEEDTRSKARLYKERMDIANERQPELTLTTETTTQSARPTPASIKRLH